LPISRHRSRTNLLTGTGSDQSHLLLVCTGERGLCGPFNSAIVRLVRHRTNSLLGEGKHVKFVCVGRKGFDQLKRQYEDRIIETVDLRALRQIKFENASGIGQKIIALFDAGQFDV
jgi:F-type H+-transporting ATPase subunit gamma